MNTKFSASMEGGLLSAFSQSDARRLFIIQPGPLSRFYVQADFLFHESRHQTARAIYQADSPKAARQVLDAINTALQAQRTLHRQYRNLVLATLFGAGIALALTASLHTALSRPTPILPSAEEVMSRLNAPAPLASPAHAPPLMSSTPSEQPPMPPQEKQPSPTEPPAQQLAYRTVAQKLQAAAASGQYTLALSSGHERTLYVFADPLCPHCREMEPVLDALSRDYNIEIFPVTLIGQQDTVNLVSPVLCAPAQARKGLWQQLFTGGAGMMPGDPAPVTACAAGTQAMARNDGAYNDYHLPGTPTLLADNGHQIPFSALKSDDALASFMNANPR